MPSLAGMAEAPRHEEDRSAAMAQQSAANDAATDAALDQFLDSFGDDDGGGDDAPAVAEEKAQPEHPKMREKARKEDPEDDDEPEVDVPDDEDDEDAVFAEDSEDEDDDEALASDDDEEEEGDEEDELFDAMLTLKNSGVPTRVIKSTRQDLLIPWARSVAERGAQGAEASESKPADGPAGAGGKGGRGDQEPAQAIAFDTKAHSAAFADLFGVEEDEVSKANAPLYATLDQLRKQNEQLSGQVREALSSLSAERGQAAIDSNMGRLSRVYPQLKRDSKAREELLDEVTTLAQGLQARGKDVNLKEVFDRAARSALGKAKRSDLSQLRRNGHSTPPTRRAGSFLDDTSDQGSEAAYWDRVANAAVSGRGSDYIGRIKAPKSVRENF